MKANPCKCGHSPVDEIGEGSDTNRTIISYECSACGRRTRRHEGVGVEGGRAALDAALEDWNAGRVSDPAP